MTKKEIEFLKESNAIEGVHDEESLEQAKKAWEYLKGVENMTFGVVLKTHKILMLKSKLAPNEKGYFRTVPVYIGGREAISFHKIREELKEWCDGMMATNPSHDPEALHIIYEHIHGFVDGNGRTGRMFMNWHRIKKNGLPIFIIHADWPKKDGEQASYYKWFK